MNKRTVEQEIKRWRKLIPDLTPEEEIMIREARKDGAMLILGNTFYPKDFDPQEKRHESKRWRGEVMKYFAIAFMICAAGLFGVSIMTDRFLLAAINAALFCINLYLFFILRSRHESKRG